MFYELIQDYTHHGGTIKRLQTIPKGTLVLKEPFNNEPGFEYSTVSYGDYDGYFLSKEIVENNPEFFRELSEEEYEKTIATLEFKNAIVEANQNLSVIEIYDAVTETFEDKTKEPDPKETFKLLLKRLQEEKEKAKEISSPPFQPYQPLPNPYNAKCHCGNDGTQPCWSTACPKRIIITYGTGTGTPGRTCTGSSAQPQTRRR
jgi:hypothetical protein